WRLSAAAGPSGEPAADTPRASARLQGGGGGAAARRGARRRRRVLASRPSRALYVPPSERASGHGAGSFLFCPPLVERPLMSTNAAAPNRLDRPVDPSRDHVLGPLDAPIT